MKEATARVSQRRHSRDVRFVVRSKNQAKGVKWVGMMVRLWLWRYVVEVNSVICDELSMGGYISY